MLKSEEQSRKTKENIKLAWREGDLFVLLQAGFEGFINAFYNDAPISFRKFLEHTGTFFDQYILEIVQKECLNYIGGKMVLDVAKKDKSEHVFINLSADLYFQTPDKKWIMKKKAGQVDSSRFYDWHTDATALELQKIGKLELAVELPELEE